MSPSPNDENAAHGFRLDPIRDTDWPGDLAELLDGFAGRLNVYRTMAHHPALLRAWVDLREHLVNRSSLGPEAAEVVILRTGVRLGNQYEWCHHVQRARKLGLSDTRIASIRGPTSEMAPKDARLAQAVDELFASSALAPNTSSALGDEFGKEGVLDLMATVGFYSTLGFILNTFETPLDDEIQSELNGHPLP